MTAHLQRYSVVAGLMGGSMAPHTYGPGTRTCAVSPTSRGGCAACRVYSTS